MPKVEPLLEALITASRRISECCEQMPEQVRHGHITILPRGLQVALFRHLPDPEDPEDLAKGCMLHATAEITWIDYLNYRGKPSDILDITIEGLMAKLVGDETPDDG